MEDMRRCDYCNKNYIPEKNFQRFCCSKCRHKFHDNKTERKIKKNKYHREYVKRPDIKIKIRLWDKKRYVNKYPKNKEYYLEYGKKWRKLHPDYMRLYSLNKRG